MATVTQLRVAGWTRVALDQARETRRQEPIPQVVVPYRGPVDGDHRLVATGIWAGKNAALSGGVALQRRGQRVARARRPPC